MWKFDLVAAINIVAGAVLAVLLTLVKDWLWDHLRPQRGVRIEAIEERGPTSRQYGFTERAVRVTVKNESSADISIQDIRLMFTREYGAPVLPEAPPARSHPKLPTTLAPDAAESWYFPAEMLSSLLQTLLVAAHPGDKAIKLWPRVVTISGSVHRGATFRFSADPNSHWP